MSGSNVVSPGPMARLAHIMAQASDRPSASAAARRPDRSAPLTVPGPSWARTRRSPRRSAARKPGPGSWPCPLRPCCPGPDPCSVRPATVLEAASAVLVRPSGRLHAPSSVRYTNATTLLIDCSSPVPMRVAPVLTTEGDVRRGYAGRAGWPVGVWASVWLSAAAVASGFEAEAVQMKVRASLPPVGCWSGPR
jgi:hypothetical protein